MSKRFISFVLWNILLVCNLSANSFDDYKQSFNDFNYNKIFALYQENIYTENKEQYKEYLFNEITKALSTNHYHAQKLINQFLHLEPNSTYGRYFLALFLYEEKNFSEAFNIVKQLQEGYLESDLKMKVELLFDKLDKIIYQSKPELKTFDIQKANNQYFVTVRIDNLTLRLLIDTGATTTMLNNSVMQKLYYTTIKENIEIQTASGITKAKRIEIQRLSIDDLDFDRVEIISSYEDVFRGFDGLLGMNILKHFQIDTKKNQLIFEH